MYDIYVPLVDVEMADPPPWSCGNAEKRYRSFWYLVYGPSRGRREFPDGQIFWKKRQKQVVLTVTASMVCIPICSLTTMNNLDSAFTFSAHEMGHAMDFYYRNKEQPSQPPTRHSQQVASTVHESLLMEHLLQTITDPHKKMYLINYTPRNVSNYTLQTRQCLRNWTNYSMIERKFINTDIFNS